MIVESTYQYVALLKMSHLTNDKPSPPDHGSFWQKTPTSTTCSSRRSLLSDTEPFSISRESFESYRRSFVCLDQVQRAFANNLQDISARSPVYQPDPRRTSLDSARYPRSPRSAIHGIGSFERPPPTDEEGFEDVGLHDEVKPKKRGLFSRFGDSTEPTGEDQRPGSSHRGFHLPGMKRGHSGQGAELGSFPKPNGISTDQRSATDSDKQPS